jgi:hypothetical protein
MGAWPGPGAPHASRTRRANYRNHPFWLLAAESGALLIWVLGLIAALVITLLSLAITAVTFSAQGSREVSRSRCSPPYKRLLR